MRKRVAGKFASNHEQSISNCSGIASLVTNKDVNTVKSAVEERLAMASPLLSKLTCEAVPP